MTNLETSRHDGQTNGMPSAISAEGPVPVEVLSDTSAGVFMDARRELTHDTFVGPPPYDLLPRYTGRDEPLAQLMGHVQTAIDTGRLSFVLLCGEPGMGKSRTIVEFGRRLARVHRDVRMLVGRGDGGGIAYAAFGHLFARRFGIAPGMGASASHERILARVAEVLPGDRVTEVAHLLAYLMRIPFPDSPVVSPLAASPQQLQTRTFIAVRRFLSADAQRSPIVLVIEDLEVCGPETVNLVHYLVAGLASERVVIVGTARASVFEQYPSFGDSDVPLMRIELEPLSDHSADALLRDLCRPLAEVPEPLFAHARVLGGSPRALLELMRLLLESGILARNADGEWVIDKSALASTPLPEGYEDLVARRLEVMAHEDRDILSMAAVVGETFWLDAVVALTRSGEVDTEHPDGPTLSAIAATGNRSRTAVMNVLARLTEREWIQPVAESSVPGEHEYRFTYPHLRRMVLARIPDADLREYHWIAAQWLELRPEGRRPLEREDVAEHLQRAGRMLEAAARYRRAADVARAGYFNDRAIRLYLRALACIGDRDPVTRIHLWHDLGTVYDLTGDFEAALGAFERMLRLAWVVAARTKAAVAFSKMGRVWRRKGALELALEYLERGAELFEQTGDQRGIAASLDDVGRVLYLLGRYDEAYAKVTAGLERRGRDSDQRSMAMSLSNLANIESARGRFDEAREHHRQALELRRASGDRSGVIGSLNNIAVIDYERGDLAQARAGWVQALSEAGAIGALPLSALALSNLGELALSENDYDEARRRLEEALTIATDIDDRRLQAEVKRNLALVESALGHTSEAVSLAHRSLQAAAAAGLRDCEARALICLGCVLSRSIFVSGSQGAGPENALGYFERGLAMLRELGNASELARGLEAFGTYHLECGQQSAGVAVLREALLLYERLGMKRAERVHALLAKVH